MRYVKTIDGNVITDRRINGQVPEVYNDNHISVVRKLESGRTGRKTVLVEKGDLSRRGLTLYEALETTVGQEILCHNKKRDKEQYVRKRIFLLGVDNRTIKPL